MVIVRDSLSQKLYDLFVAWVVEQEENRQHDIEEVEAWNALVAYLMELEAVKNAQQPG